MLISKFSAAMMAAGLALAPAVTLANPPAGDPLLQEAVHFTGTVLFVDSGVPALIIGAIRNGETAVAGFGDADGKGTEPDGDTILRIGSVTKVFTGQVLASMVADGTVNLTDPLQSRIGWDITVPERDGHIIRLIDLATHTSGLTREFDYQPGPPDDPNSTQTPRELCPTIGKHFASFRAGHRGVLFRPRVRRPRRCAREHGGEILRRPAQGAGSRSPWSERYPSGPA